MNAWVTGELFSAGNDPPLDVVLHAKPLRNRKGRRKEGSGDYADSESFSWNVKIAKNVTDSRKNCMVSHMRVCRKYGVA